MDLLSFKYNSQETYNLREFYDKFRERLPLWVIVTDGNDGGTSYDDYSNNQVLRFHKVCTQRRVIVRETQEAVRHSTIFLSLPVKSRLLYCVVRGPNRVDGLKNLQQILGENVPHFMIRLAAGQNTAFGKTMEGNLDNLLVIKEYTEYYIQGNCLTPDGLIKLPCTASLTSDISVAIITGIVGKSPQEFRDSIGKMDAFVKEKVQFDDEIDNPHIRRYKYGDVELQGIVGSDMLFPGEDIYARPTLPPRHEEEVGSIYETLEPDPKWVPPRPPKPKLPQKDVKTITASSPDTIVPPRKPTKVYQRKEKADISVQYKHNSEESGTYVTTLETFRDQYYTKPIVRADSLTLKEDNEPRYESVNLREDSTATMKCREEKTEYRLCSEIENLSVQDLGMKLKLLKLDKYVKKFKKERIDGLLLSKLNEDILRTEFKFTQTEVIRLMTFVHTGHLPH